jgi:RHS repeat-associated protein
LHLPNGAATDDGTGWRYGLVDGLGSVRQRVDDGGQVLSVESYRPFGLPLEGDGGAPYGYTGEWWEGGAELLYLRARYYDPLTGRFISRDVWSGFAGFPQSQNRYSYVRNNAIRWTDPSGYMPEGPDVPTTCCSEPMCFIFYFPGTEKTDNKYRTWGHGEPILIDKLEKLATILFVVFPFGAGAGYTGEQIADLEARPGAGGLCGEALGSFSSGSVQEQQVLDIWNGTADWLSETKADEIAMTLQFFGVYADSPNLEIEFVAHSGGAYYAVGAAQSLSRYGLEVDNVVTLGGLFKVHDWRTDGLDNIGHLYDIISQSPAEPVTKVRGPICTGFDSYHGQRAFWRDEHPHLWELEQVTKINAGTDHSSYFTDTGVWKHLSTKTARLCKRLRWHRLLRDGWSELKNW